MKKQELVTKDGLIVLTKDKKRLTIVSEKSVLIDIKLSELKKLYTNSVKSAKKWREWEKRKKSKLPRLFFKHLNSQISFCVYYEA